MSDLYQNIYKKNPKDLTREDIKIIVENPETPGAGRGEHIIVPLLQIQKKMGEEGPKRVLQEMASLGYPINPKEMDSLGWEPVGLRALLMIALIRVYGFNDEDFQKMGEEAVGFSFVVKFFFKHFQSRKTAFKHVPDYWAKHYTCGELKPVKFSEKKGNSFYIMRLHNFKVYPSFCQFFLGYFLQVSKLLGGGAATIEETKCMFRGDPYHEFLVKWK